ncbi:hypothetical protein [Citrobacter meridianamericanus]|uniref:hypothetical protein n=1 Tax=Citrobacter meridianamericanus TaxID=2894201 RepID=UPI00351D88DB
MDGVKTQFRDILSGGSGLSVSNSNLMMLNKPVYYTELPALQNYTYRFAIRQKTIDISNLKQEVSKDYPLNSLYCTEPSGRIEKEYSLTSTYVLGNGLPNMHFTQKVDGATSNVDRYTFHTVVDFLRVLNVNIAAVPDAIDFGDLSNKKSAQRDIKITLNGLP